MTLGQKQELFARLYGQLLCWIDEQGWAARLGEVLRTKEQAEIYAAQGKGIKNSVHRLKLAGDLFLSVDGKVVWDGPEYKACGEYWKSLHESCRWGGDFRPRRDVYHFSLIHNGVY